MEKGVKHILPNLFVSCLRNFFVFSLVFFFIPGPAKVDY